MAPQAASVSSYKAFVTKVVFDIFVFAGNCIGNFHREFLCVVLCLFVGLSMYVPVCVSALLPVCIYLLVSLFVLRASFIQMHRSIFIALNDYYWRPLIEDPIIPVSVFFVYVKYAYLSVLLSIPLFVSSYCPSVFWTSSWMSITLLVFLPVECLTHCLAVCLSVPLSVCLYACLSACLCIGVCLQVRKKNCQSTVNLLMGRLVRRYLWMGRLLSPFDKSQSIGGHLATERWQTDVLALNQFRVEDGSLDRTRPILVQRSNAVYDFGRTSSSWKQTIIAAVIVINISP